MVRSSWSARWFVLVFALLGPALASCIPFGWSSWRSADPQFVDLLVGVVCLVASVAYGWLSLGALLTLLAGSRSRFAVAANRLASLVAPVLWRQVVGTAFRCAATALPMAGTLVGASQASPAIGVVPTAWLRADRGGADVRTSLDGLPMPDRPQGTLHHSSGAVVVAPGDSLWSIAARQLPRTATDEQVAAAWPAWYRANRRSIGPDPGLIHPGTLLHFPRPIPFPGEHR
jgi:hypothetical protein